MSDSPSIEIAHSLTEDDETEGVTGHHGWHRALEVLEVLLLAVVAIATAWSGFQAAQWDGRQTLRYGEATRDRFDSNAASTYGGQLLTADASFFTAWLQAHAAGQADLETLYTKRMSPDYKVAFDAWLATNPFTDASAPGGPAIMAEYKNPYFEKAASLDVDATRAFEEGTAADDTAGRYVRDTVLFAMVLFVVAIAQRVKDRAVRAGANAIALLVLVYAVVSVVDLPRL